MITTELAHAYFEQHQAQILADWFELLRFPSIGADRQRLGDCSRCAAWLKRYVRAMGFVTEIRLANEHPVLLAERPGKPGAPVVLFYGHYDVQPADPLELWSSQPFEPELREGRVYARGASDNKGQIFAFLQGVAALLAAGVEVPTIRLVLEGEEESGSDGLIACLSQWRQSLQADVMLVSDSSAHASGRPAIIAGMRGILHLTVTLRGATRDLHSGSHGGVAPNASAGMARLLASLHDAQGRIAVPGFLECVVPPTPQELACAQAEPFDAAEYERTIGVAPLGGEAGLSAVERASFRPTIEVNGVHSGYGGPGSKTVLPAQAVAKLSARLCPGQSPRASGEQIVAHLQANCPPGLTLEISELSTGAPALRLSLETPVMRLAEEVLQQLDPRGAVFEWMGASIPVIGALRDVSGASPLLVGFAREEDAIHAPNESFGLDQFQADMTYASLILAALAGEPLPPAS
jgi:acetylornithine deacetylase/succinyl-diaminopimelate desuccinylase-like protein